MFWILKFVSFQWKQLHYRWTQFFSCGTQKLYISGNIRRWPLALPEFSGQCARGPNSLLVSSAAFRPSGRPPWTLRRTAHLKNKTHAQWTQILHCWRGQKFILSEKLTVVSDVGLWISPSALTVSIDVDLVKHHVGKVLCWHLTGQCIDRTDGLNTKMEDHVENQCWIVAKYIYLSTCTISEVLVHYLSIYIFMLLYAFMW